MSQRILLSWEVDIDKKQPKERKEPIYLPPGVFWVKFMYFHLSLFSDLLRALTLSISVYKHVWVMNTCLQAV